MMKDKKTMKNGKRGMNLGTIDRGASSVFKGVIVRNLFGSGFLEGEPVRKRMWVRVFKGSRRSSVR